MKMSRPQEPHRPFFHFGNPFRIISPKGSQFSPRLLSLLNAFEATLSQRLQKLVPKDKDDILSLSWMKLAMNTLSEIHCDIKNLITELELPVSDWEEKWIDVYLEISVKLLDISIAFTSELTRLNQGHLLLQFVLHKLESNSPEQFMRTCSSVDSWRQHLGSKNPRVEACRTILDNLVGSLNLPKVKNSAKGKVLMRAMYGAKVATVYICSVFAAAFSGSDKNLLDLTVADTLPWAQVFSDVQTTVNAEIRNIFSCGKFSVLTELDAVDACVQKLYPLLQDGLGSIEGESFKNYVSDLRKTAEKLSQGLDNLSKVVDGFFKIVLTGRDALLCNLRAGGAVPNSMVGRKVEEQVVR
ncbi:protein BPS1, chloroplastic [Durio zibethinus]|uniref:Protein BPS1, chloroplastic n=1 Tax=Durio zibethinus TaxID=66656 RepID=A0A6P6B0A4_DURZI|nr:protein BPS1, chloroplastic [Durio zibethinus]